MMHYLSKLAYPVIYLDSNNIDKFWLEGNFKVSPFDQVSFLERFYRRELPIEARTHTIMNRLMILSEDENGVLRGKTGWALREDNNTGWFVGFLETKEDCLVFATKISPKEGVELNGFPALRKKVTFEALKQLGYWE